ncbi:MAG: hypothetical protein AAF560_13440 [Acidobacteriota bacterium]
MYSNNPRFRQPIGFGGGNAGPPPPDILLLIGVLFITYSLQFFSATSGLMEQLQLSRDVWQRGFLWQVVTYPFVAEVAGSLWFLLSLLIIFWFGRDVYRYLGQRRFWQLLAWGFGTGAAVAIVVQLLMDAAGVPSPYAFSLMRGQTMVLTVLIAAFATVYGNATIMLMFVLPLKARWFLGLEILFAFMGYLTTKDFAGFLGICATVGMVYQILTGGGLRRALRELRLRIERQILEARLKRMRRKSDLKIVKPPPDDDGPGGPWVN